MKPPVFYAATDSIGDDSIVLSAAESRHAVKVMRLQSGDRIIVADGQGMAYRGTIAKASITSIAVTIEAPLRRFGEPAVHLTLAAGLSAGYKFDSVVQRGTELGVSRFVPLVCEKSKVKMDESRWSRSRLNRLRNVALAAMKQCRRSLIPKIESPMTIADFLGEEFEAGRRVLFHSGSGAGSLESVAMTSETGSAIAVVGPEAGFTEAEVTALRRGGFVPVGLGDRVLRTETAGPVACALMMYRLGEFN